MTKLLAAVVVGGLLTPGAWAQKVRTDFDRGFDFSGFKTYAWKVHPALERDPELRESVGAELVRMAVNQQLIAKGFEPIEAEFADFYVTVFGSRERGTEVTGAIGGQPS